MENIQTKTLENSIRGNLEKVHVMNKREEPLEEKIAREAVVAKYQDGFLCYRHEPNGDYTFPDYQLNYSSHKVLLEVVRGMGFDVSGEADKGLHVKTREIKHPAQGLIDEFMASNYKLLSFLKSDETLSLFFDMPEKGIKKLAKAISDSLRSEYDARGLKYDERVSLKIQRYPELDVEVQLTNFYSLNPGRIPKLIIGSTNSCNSKYLVVEASCSSQANYILKSNILDKHKKLLTIPTAQHCYSKWLAIIHESPILSLADYIEAYGELDINGSDYFDKIFIIYNGEAIELKK